MNRHDFFKFIVVFVGTIVAIPVIMLVYLAIFHPKHHEMFLSHSRGLVPVLFDMALKEDMSIDEMTELSTEDLLDIIKTTEKIHDRPNAPIEVQPRGEFIQMIQNDMLNIDNSESIKFFC